MHLAPLLIGIDEAGYGPLLGPLVISATCFEVNDRWLDGSLWKLLKASISNSPSKSRRLPICDSKKLHKPAEGIGRLEKSALAGIFSAGIRPANLSELLARVCPDAASALSSCPWYGDLRLSLPRSADPNSIAIAGGLLGRDMLANGGKMLGVYSEVLPEADFNRMVAGTRNKAVVLLGLTNRLIHRIGQAFPGRDMRICVDKQGGRDFYGRALLRDFEDRSLKVCMEEDDFSEYELADERSTWRISFSQEGESKHMPIALASLISKYVRELLMECLNTYWLTHIPTLKPTAGYYTDGMRFLREIRPHFERLGIDDRSVVRER